ncbi:MAG: MaoC/PaaZ C-terminal domain-containing protein [Pseudomonadota bacterium]
MSETLKEMPNPNREYFGALGTLRRKPGKEITIPALEVCVTGVRAKPENLAAYREVCGFADGDSLPITYPHVLAAPLHIRLMTGRQFPLPMLGLVHLRNKITQTRELAVDETFDVRVHTGVGRQTSKGLEFDFMTRYSDAQGQEVWTGETTILFRNRPAGGGVKKPPAAPDPRIAEYAELNAPADIGRRYGRIAGDLNPIHLYAMTAKLFGFPRAIAHGMWTLARSAALTGAQLGRAPRELTVQFKQPLLLPARASLKVVAGDKGLEFSLLGASGGKVHLAGAIA